MGIQKVQTGRPRILVDFAIVLRMRETDNLGWSRMAKAYVEKTGQYITVRSVGLRSATPSKISKKEGISGHYQLIEAQSK